MVPTRRRPSAQGIKCPTVHSGHIQQQVIGYSGCEEWPPRSPDLNPLDFILYFNYTSNSESLQPLHQHCRNFETVLRMLVPACHLPCCRICSGKCSPMSRCVLSLKDTSLSMTDR
ncbi:hypothetical protein AVEN_255857-1 [Araneus ventricosus]|uniref:Uncharacterized protein n=1 Tax=Araneus ventricosus TaxID=182803 RepID=A0A4Y2ENA8_ARAVE|nr:hypothetical protein AVEN_255857-1 [Araneus ventricosus]